MVQKESYYVAAFGVRTNDADFLRPTLNMLNSGRLILSWSYIREFYSDSKRISQVEKNMWSFGLSELEVHVDRVRRRKALFEASFVHRCCYFFIFFLASRVVRKGSIDSHRRRERVSQVEARDGESGSGGAAVF
jgi:hypothetical protein